MTVFTADLAYHEVAEQLDLLKEYIIPAVKFDKPLPKNAQAQAELQSRIDSFVNMNWNNNKRKAKEKG